MGKFTQAVKSHKAIVGIGVLLVVGLVVFVLVWFQPQKLFIDQRVDEAFPSPAKTTTTTSTSPSQAPVTSSVPPTTAAPAGPQTLGAGEFIKLAHPGTGRAAIIQEANGARVLRLEDLNIENGPDLFVILSKSELVKDGDAYAQDYQEIARLKGNQGNQNYDIPQDLDLSSYKTVAIWCKRFNSTFNAAPLAAA